jgi:hypothetical protein
MRESSLGRTLRSTPYNDSLKVSLNLNLLHLFALEASTFGCSGVEAQRYVHGRRLDCRARPLFGRQQSALGWLGKKIDAAADSFVQAFGKTFRVAAGMAVTAGGGLLIPPVMKLVVKIFDHVTRWLSHVTLPF